MDGHELSLDEALLHLNDWLGQSVRLLLLIRLGASDELPPSRPAEGWHVLAGHEGELDRPTSKGPQDLSNFWLDLSPEGDFIRELNIGTYELGDGPLKLLLDGLPCERVLAIAEKRGEPAKKLAFYLSGPVVLVLLRPE